MSHVIFIFSFFIFTVANKYNACSQGDLLCDTPTFKCVEVGDFPFSSVMCLRQCSQNNGGCNEGQVCVEKPVCMDCNASNIVDGTCLNTKSKMCVFKCHVCGCGCVYLYCLCIT